MKQRSDFTRVIWHAIDFYRERSKLLFLFSLPFVFALLIPLLVQSPTYLALGGVFVRGGSIPAMSMLDWVITAIAYIVSIFIIADSLVNINLIIKSKRTLTNTSTEVIKGIEHYAMKVFLVSVIFSLVLSAFFLLTYEIPFQSVIYPLLCLLATVMFFFSVPAIVIDEKETFGALRASYNAVVRKPVFVALWLIIAVVMFFAIGMFAYLFPSFLTQYVFLLLNSVIMVPFLIVLATQMYMEKYPLAK